jgi:hypothetical protein
VIQTTAVASNVVTGRTFGRSLRLLGASVTSSSAGTEAMLPLNPLVIKGLNACLIEKRLSGGDASPASLAAGRRVYPTTRARHSPKPIGT